MTSLGSGVDLFGPFMDGDAIPYRIAKADLVPVV